MDVGFNHSSFLHRFSIIHALLSIHNLWRAVESLPLVSGIPESNRVLKSGNLLRNHQRLSRLFFVLHAGDDPAFPG